MEFLSKQDTMYFEMLEKTFVFNQDIARDTLSGPA